MKKAKLHSIINPGNTLVECVLASRGGGGLEASYNNGFSLLGFSNPFSGAIFRHTSFLRGSLC